MAPIAKERGSHDVEALGRQTCEVPVDDSSKRALTAAEKPI